MVRYGEILRISGSGCPLVFTQSTFDVSLWKMYLLTCTDLTGKNNIPKFTFLFLFSVTGGFGMLCFAQRLEERYMLSSKDKRAVEAATAKERICLFLCVGSENVLM